MERGDLGSIVGPRLQGNINTNLFGGFWRQQWHAYHQFPSKG